MTDLPVTETTTTPGGNVSTFQMNPYSTPAPAGTINYGCHCKSVAVWHGPTASWIVKRCGRILRSEGGARDFTVRSGNLVGRHYDGHTTAPIRILEWALWKLGHSLVGVALNSPPNFGGNLHMEGHTMTMPRFAASVRVWTATFGVAHVRPSLDGPIPPGTMTSRELADTEDD